MSEHKNISEQIIDLVDEALDSKNFGKLSSSINDLLNPGGTDYRPLDHMKGQTYNQYKQQNAYGGSSAGRAAYEARRKQMMSGQPHDANMGSRPQQIRLQNGTALDQRLFKMPEGEGVLGIILMVLMAS